jgi:hypothetical protein
MATSAVVGPTVVVGPTGYAAVCLRNGTVAGADITQSHCQRLTVVRHAANIEATADGACRSVVFAHEPVAVSAAAVNGDDAIAVVRGNAPHTTETGLHLPCTPTVLVLSVSTGSVLWAVTLPPGDAVESVGVLSANRVMAVTSSGRLYALQDKVAPRVIATDAAVVAAADEELFATILTPVHGAASLVVAAFPEGDDDTSLSAVSTFSLTDLPNNLKERGGLRQLAVSLADVEEAVGHAPCFALLTLSAGCVLCTPTGHVAHVFTDATAVTALSSWSFLVGLSTHNGLASAVGVAVITPAPDTAAAADSSPATRKTVRGSQRPSKKVDTAPKAANVEVVMYDLPISRMPHISSIAISPDRTQAQVVGGRGSTGLASVVFSIRAPAAITAAEAVESPLTSAETIWGTLASALFAEGGITRSVDGALASRPTTTCHYAKQTVGVDTNIRTTVVTAVTASHAIHIRRARRTQEHTAVAELLRLDQTFAYRAVGATRRITLQWNHAVLRGAMKQLGGTAAQKLVHDAAAACKASEDFLEAMSACANAVGAGVTLQHQLGFRTPLPTRDLAGIAAQRDKTTAMANLQFYGQLLAAGRWLAGPCSAIAARWDALMLDSQRRGHGAQSITATAADSADANGNGNGNGNGAPTSSSRRNGSNALPSSTAMRLVHGSGGRGVPRVGGSDTVAEAVHTLLGALPEKIRERGAVFATASSAKTKNTRTEDEPSASQRAVDFVMQVSKQSAGLQGMSTYELQSLGLKSVLVPASLTAADRST